MKALEKENLGKCKEVGRILVFYKILPSKVEHKVLNMSKEQYKEIFLTEDTLVTQEWYSKMIDSHPERALLRGEGLNVEDLEAAAGHEEDPHDSDGD